MDRRVSVRIRDATHYEHSNLSGQLHLLEQSQVGSLPREGVTGLHDGDAVARTVPTGAAMSASGGAASMKEVFC